MCGIIGYTGAKSAPAVLVEGLKNLEYRGYDSAGIAVCGESGAITAVKTKGRLADLEALVEKQKPTGHVGIGHTRWATHGEPNDVNSHPHCTPKVALVHNGIIENYTKLKAFLTEKGYTFLSQTDTETAVYLIDYYYDGDPLAAIAKALKQIEGSYAFAILFTDFPDRIYGVRKDSPLIVALGEGENFFASDMPAVLQYTRRYHLLEEGEIAVVASDGVAIYASDLTPVQKPVLTATWDIAQAQKGGYDHFMLKEIHEQPTALHATVSPRLSDGLPDFTESGLAEGFFTNISKLYIVACGTAMHAGMLARHFFEGLAKLPVEVDISSEFRYRNPLLQKDQLCIIISQSGETADTLAALRLCKKAGVPTLAVVNVSGSSIAREADHCIYTYAGPEIAVASTKAYSVQVALMFMLAVKAGLERGALAAPEAKGAMTGLLHVIEGIPDVLALSDEIKAYAANLADIQSLFFLGRGIDYALVMEASLKLKEVSYIHCEAYAAGELKHGPISLIEEHVPIIALATQTALLPKMVSNIKEVKARGGKVLVIAKDGFEVDPTCYDQIIRLPAVNDQMMPSLAIVLLQLLAYYAATLRGCDVDKPRNLAKSVTVE